MVKLQITGSTPWGSINAEKRFSDELTVGEFKKKLEMMFGTNPDDMILQHRNDSKDVIYILQPDTATLGDFEFPDFGNVHVVDNKAADEELNEKTATEQMESVPKYEISDEAYKKKDDTFLKWKQQNLPKKQKGKDDGKLQEYRQMLKEKADQQTESKQKNLKRNRNEFESKQTKVESSEISDDDDTEL